MKKIYTNYRLILTAIFGFVTLFSSTNAFAVWTFTPVTDIPYVVSAVNVPPVCNAGANRNITLPTNFVTIPAGGATVTDSDGTVVSTVWSQVGTTPATATIVNGNTLTPTFTSLVAGTYTFRLTGQDNQGATCTSDMNVIVSSSSPTGTLTAPNCRIALGASSCVSNISWTTSNAVTPVTVERGYSPFGIMASGTSGGPTGFTFTPPGSYPILLKDNGVQLDTQTVVVSCAVGTSWDGSICTSAVVNGVCSPSHWLCAAGTSINNTTNASSWNWDCQGSGGGSTISCKEPFPKANGACAATHFSCLSGTSANNVTGGSSWTWDCLGTGGGTNALGCTENFPVGKPQCSDGKDNDLDGYADTLDPSCHTDCNAKNDATYDSTLNNEAKKCIKPVYIEI